MTAAGTGWGVLALQCPRCRHSIAVSETGAACAACGSTYPASNGILDLRQGRVGAAGFDPHYFPALAAVDGVHYWFVARREVVRDVLRDAVPDLERRALFDVGCGSGGLLGFLAASGVRIAGACDVYPESLELARRRVDAPLLLLDDGSFPPLGPGQSLLSLFDVLEHLDDDEGTLRRLRALLEPGGFLVLTVPAHPLLFDEMDVIAHHRRRYTRGELRSKLEAAGFAVRHLAHFMAPLVPLVVLRAARRLLDRGSNTAERRMAELAVTPVLNPLLLALLRLERPVVRRGGLPFGSSLIAVAERPATAAVTSAA